MSAVIECDSVVKQFGALKAIDGLTFSVEAGEVFGMLGPNGAGKTTMVRLINGLLAASGGRLRTLGFDPITQGDRVRAHTGVLTETPSLYERFSARDNLLLFGRLYHVAPEKLTGRVDAVLRDLGLAERARDKVGGYSKGMKQRLAIARALLHEPQILFLDEPTAGLDPEAARHVTDLIEKLSREGGRTVLLATHNLTEAQRLCDRVAVLNQGRALAVGTPAQLSRDLWRSTWLDVELRGVNGGAPTDRLLAQVRAVPMVKAAAMEGHSLSLQVESEEAIPQMVAHLVRLGAQIVRVNPREHTLEEIYFALQEQAEKAV
ncbi:MAG: ABC transporter ATP-binding protein [Chloroflexi bacterium]|nr:ABC transporter ATP-binding protein [Chloroflexota bacterium]